MFYCIQERPKNGFDRRPTEYKDTSDFSDLRNNDGAGVLWISNSWYSPIDRICLAGPGYGGARKGDSATKVPEQVKKEELSFERAICNNQEGKFVVTRMGDTQHFNRTRGDVKARRIAHSYTEST